MSSVTEPTIATATREPILICYDDSPDAEHAGRPVLIVPPPR
jgi:hypothetical protein